MRKSNCSRYLGNRSLKEASTSVIAPTSLWAATCSTKPSMKSERSWSASALLDWIFELRTIRPSQRRWEWTASRSSRQVPSASAAGPSFSRRFSSWICEEYFQVQLAACRALAEKLFVQRRCISKGVLRSDSLFRFPYRHFHGDPLLEFLPIHRR